MNPVATFLLFQGLFVVSRTQLDEFCCDIFLFFQGHNWMNSVARFLFFKDFFVVSRTKLDVVLIVSRTQLDEFY